jgi:aspartate racemase
MKTLGLIGGTTWVSTREYYACINREVNRLKGGYHSAKIILYSMDFQEIYTMQHSGDFEGIQVMLAGIAKGLASEGAQGLLLCANTMHKYADAVQEACGLPLIHIADVTAMEIRTAGYDTVGLLGTNTTMNEPFYRKKLQSYGIKALVPDEAGRNYINDAIFNELGKDIFKDSTRQEILQIMNKLVAGGAQGIILGCTEIPLIIKPQHTAIPLFDTLEIHSRAAARFIASGF